MSSIKIYLDARAIKDDSLAPLKVMINHNSQSAFIPLNVKIRPSQWDEKNQLVDNHTQKKSLNKFLTIKKNEYELALLELSSIKNIYNLSAKDLKYELLSYKGEVKIEKKEVYFKDIYDKYVSLKTRINTVYVYEYSLKKIKNYFGEKFESLTFKDLDIHTVLSLKSALESKYKPNTCVVVLRCIKAVFNYALEEGLIDFYPIKRINTKYTKTKNKVLSIESLRYIFNYRTTDNNEQTCVDVFKLTFYLIGINSIDLIANDNLVINQGRVEYNRSKTGRFYSIKIEPEAQKIIDKYKSQNKIFKSRYSYNVNYFIRNTNLTLKRITHNDEISIYYARHTWATLASYLEIPKDTIAFALGHGQFTVTDVYIYFDQTKVDKANRKVIDYVLYNKCDQSIVLPSDNSEQCHLLNGSSSLPSGSSK